MSRVLIVFAVLVAAVLVALYAFDDRDYVVIGYGSWVVETSLTVFLALVLAFSLPAYLLVQLVRGLAGTPQSVRSWRSNRRERKVEDSLRDGLVALAEGHWKQAETRFKRSIELKPSMLANLGAARAAHGLGAGPRRDHYLRQAHVSAPSSKLAVGMAQAEMQIEDAQYEQALATLTHIRTQAPSNQHLLRLLRDVAEQLKDWQRVIELVPALREHKVLTRDAADALEIKAFNGLLAQAIGSGDINALNWRWEAIPPGKRLEPEVVVPYARKLVEIGQGAKAETLLHAAITHRWNDELVLLYGLTEGEDPNKQLAQAETWLETQPRSAPLLLTLGRLCARVRLWGKARSYLESSLAVAPGPETYRVLAVMLDELGETEAAAECARRGLVQATTGGADARREQLALPHTAVKRSAATKARVDPAERAPKAPGARA